MKILIVRTDSSEANLSHYNVQEIGLASELIRLGHEASIVFYAKPGSEREEVFYTDGIPIRIFYIGEKKFGKVGIYNQKLFDLCKEYDVIQTAEADQISSWLLHKYYPEKTIIYHGPYESEYTWKHNIYVKIFDLFFLHKCGFQKTPVITKSVLAEDYLRKKKFENVTTLGVGYNPNVFSENTEEAPAVLKKLLEEKNNDKYFLYIGEISQRKNLLFLLKVMSRFVNDGKKENYKLLVVGSANDENYFKKCKKYIDENNLSDYIIFCGKCEQRFINLFYQISDVFVLPTQYDIFGMVYLEAMYFGVPVVTTLCGGSSTLIRNENTGFILNLNAEEWCNTIENILNNEKKYQLISAKEKELIRSEFLWSKLAEKFENVYKKMTKAK